MAVLRSNSGPKPKTKTAKGGPRPRTAPRKKIRLLIVDDSIVFRTLISSVFEHHPTVEVVGTASNPFEARDKILSLRPDVMTLDVEMPRMNGIEFLKILMPQKPMPVIVVSSLSNIVFDAMHAGAVDFVQKPPTSTKADKDRFRQEIAEKVAIASDVYRRQAARQTRPSIPAQPAAPLAVPRLSGAGIRSRGLIALGASTGGTEATSAILKRLPKNIPGMVITQHMPPVFTDLYAKRMDRESELTVKEAEEFDVIRPGHVFVAPGDKHLTVEKLGNDLVIRLKKTEKVNGHIPSVDVMFQSIAKFADKSTTGIILTGMGADGAQGLLELRRKGAYTIGQDEASSVVYGMPMVAQKLGAVVQQASLDRIPQLLVQHLAMP